MDEEAIFEQTDLTSVQTPTSTRTTESPVWKEFEKLPLSYHKDGRQRARCIHCQEKEYVADSKTGTKNLLRHLDVCKKRPRDWSTRGGQSKRIDQDVYHEKLAKCVLRHGRPFSWAEAEGDREVHSYQNDDVKFICRNTMKSKCLKLREKYLGLLKSFLESLPGKVCLTTDLWTSIISEGYLCLTVHCIDSNWKLSSRVLNFCRVPPPHSTANLCEIIHQLLKEWGLEKKVLSITMDNASNMDNLHSMLSSRLSSSGGLFHIRCCAHILNLVVQTGLKHITEALKNIRDSVKYVKGGDARITKFKECANLVGVNCSKGLWLDVVTRWNSTFQMLDRAIMYRKVFEILKVVDRNYSSLPSAQQWHRANQIHKILKPFDSITNLFSGSDYPTSNLYFENVWKVQMRLSELSQSPDLSLKQKAVEMIEKFDKYWGEYNHVLSFGAILDPRYKLGFIKARYKKLNEEWKVDVLKEQFQEMFNEYALLHGDESFGVNNEQRSSNVGLRGIQDGEDNLNDYSIENEDSNLVMTEFDIYLAERRVDSNSNFDILTYWREKQVRYPVLAAMARDILCIPITTVASESSFSIGGRILNKWRTRLLPDNVEALITARSWIYGYQDYGSDDKESANNMGEEVKL